MGIKIRKNVLYLVTLAVGFVTFMGYYELLTGENLSNAVSAVLIFVAAMSKDIIQLDNDSLPQNAIKEVLNDDHPKKCCKPEEEVA